jgi:glycosyltransferase involved in cell wall biosynthesis
MIVGFVGGIPKFAGGGGLEIQMAQSAKALASIGITVVDGTSDEQVDLVHFFGADPLCWNVIRNWSSQRVPFVVSPISVLTSRSQRIVEPWASRVRVGMRTTANMRRDVVRSADRVVALHANEADAVIRNYGVSRSRVSVVRNATDVVGAASVAPRAGLTCVGTIGDRKRQLPLVRSWGEDLPSLTLAGPMPTNWAGRDGFLTAVGERTNVQWVGRLDREEVWAWQTRSEACVSASASEGESLALLDSLALGTPVIVRESAGADALARSYPGWVLRYQQEAEIPAQLAAARSLLASNSARPEVPTWTEVATELAEIYKSVVA